MIKLGGFIRKKCKYDRNIPDIIQKITYTFRKGKMLYHSYIIVWMI